MSLHTLSLLQQILPQENIISDLLQKKPYETEWRNRYSNPAVAVIFPETVLQIQQIIHLCQANQIGIVPQGGNTSTCAGSIPNNSSLPQIILCLTKLNKIIELNIANRSISVEAGCILNQVRMAAANQGLYFPLSIGSEGSCQVGGNIATNAGGIHVIKYGMMRELVLGLEAILPDGSIVNQLKDLRKNNINFDLKQLFIGSEGTLGIITKATLKLFPMSDHNLTGLIGVPNISEAIELLHLLTKHYSVCAFEIINQLTQQIYNTHFKQQPFAIEDKWLILFELESNDSFDLSKFTQLVEKNGYDLNKIVIASNVTERERLWHSRENIPLAEKMAGFAIKHDISLPIDKIENFINLNQKHIEAAYPDAQIIIFGHLGDGNLHYNVQFSQRSRSETEQIEKNINSLVYDDVVKYGGSFSAEHGIGYLKQNWMRNYYDPISYNLAKTIKNLIDPNNIFNPDKIFPGA